MRICGLDTETTGLDYASGHRIIEIAMLTVDLVTNEVVDRYTQRINPGRTIDPGAQAVHKISLHDLRDEPSWETVAPEVMKRLEGCNVLVAHNMEFDASFLVPELIRVGLTPPAHVLPFCTKENGRWATQTGKYPRLGELAWALKVDYKPEEAHSALYDTEVLVECLKRGVTQGFFEMPSCA